MRTEDKVSDTPETDAFSGNLGDWIKFAEKLEREKNLAREETRIAVGLLSTHPQFAKFHPEEVLEMVKLEAAK